MLPWNERRVRESLARGSVVLEIQLDETDDVDEMLSGVRTRGPFLVLSLMRREPAREKHCCIRLAKLRIESVTAMQETGRSRLPCVEGDDAPARPELQLDSVEPVGLAS